MHSEVLRSQLGVIGTTIFAKITARDLAKRRFHVVPGKFFVVDYIPVVCRHVQSREIYMEGCRMPERKGASRDPDAICLGLIVKRLRVQRGWSIRQLAPAIGLHPTHLGVIERGGNLIGMSSFLNLAAVMDVDPGVILREVLENRRQFRKQPGAPPHPPPLEPPGE